MADNRQKLAKYNIYSSLLTQFVMMVSGIIVPKLFITYFGSEVYGATASIAQFLGYIVLLEGGIGGVARAVLYKPLAENNIEKLSAIFAEIEHFFRIVGYIFLVYILVLACGFQRISKFDALDWSSTFFLVCAIAISTVAQYFIGISNAVFLQAAQKTYITNMIRIVTTILNVLVIVLLMHMGCNIIVVKLISGLVFVLGPVLQWLYVKKNYCLVKVERQKDALKDKWVGMGQHLAYFFHSHTDVVVLTLFANLLLVAVYSVYSMIIGAIQSIVSSFATGMEALFGDMYAKKEYNLLNDTFSEYETLISCIAVILFSTTIVLITPFIQLYTNGVTDVDYIQPLFGVFLIIDAILYAMCAPYNAMVIAAGLFRQTRIAVYGQAVINVLLSIVLVNRFGLIGVAIGTVCATIFRFTFYAIYLAKHTVNISLWILIKRLVVNVILSGAVVFIGRMAISKIVISNYLYWALAGVIVTSIAVFVTLMGNYLFFHKDMQTLATHFVRRMN